MLFSKSEIEEIKNEIISAEKNTSGEIRIHLDKKCSSSPVDAAIKQFEKLGMTNTKDRNGVLIYLAIKDKKMAIIGDTGIDQKVPDDFWESIKDNMATNFKDGEFVKRMSLEEWQAVIDINLTGVFLCGREAAKHMIEGGQGGVIINISSVARHGNFGQTNYSATKAGVQSMAVVWAKELSKYGIRVNSIAAGFINTEMVAGMPDNVKEKLSKMVPVGRIGEPDEVAQAAEFIFANDYYSGRCVDLDGAQRM